MNVEEIKNNFLLSIGSSIKDEYLFLQEVDYQFVNNGEEKIIQINDKIIKLSYKILNAEYLDDLFYFAVNNFGKYKNNYINEMISQGVNKQVMVDICSNLYNQTINYYSDYIKYFTKKFSINVDSLQLIMTLTNNSIATINNNFDKLLQRYDVSIQGINQEAHNEVSRRNQETLAEVANASTINYGNDYYYDYLGSGYVTKGSSMSTITDTQLKGYLRANTMAA